MIFLMVRQKSGISILSLQPMLEIPSCKTIWTMRHEIRKAVADRDAHFKLARLIEAAEALAWVYTLIANTKGNIHGMYHGG
jgi:hypothetical protein